jgi:hypothetical protein
MVARQQRATRDRRPIFALLGANAVSQVGNSMTIMAGAWFVLETTGTGSYLASVTVDGEPWESVSIPHARLTDGAHLVFELSETPTGWASDSRPPSARELAGLHTPITDLTDPAGVTSTVPGAAALVDDTGGNTVRLAPRDHVDCTLRHPAPLSLYTVTAARAGSLAWRMEYRDASGTVLATEERSREPFTWDGQTRPFRVRRGTPTMTASVRFTALADAALTQLEYVPAQPENTGDRA